MNLRTSIPHLLQELRNVAENEPVFAGDTISHASAAGCGDFGWISRDTNGDWITTQRGRDRLKQGGCGRGDPGRPRWARALVLAEVLKEAAALAQGGEVTP